MNAEEIELEEPKVDSIRARRRLHRRCDSIQQSLIPMKTAIAALFLISVTALTFAQDMPPKFKGHAIGESAETFFSKATLNTPAHPLTLNFCRTQLNASGVEQYFDQAKREIEEQNPRPHKHESYDAMQKRRSADSHFVLDMIACLHVSDAVQGKDALIDSGFASELAYAPVGFEGSAQFHNGKLVCLSFYSGQEFDDVIRDMSKKLSQTPSSKDFTVTENGYGATYEYPKAFWLVGDIEANVELLDYRGRDDALKNLPSPLKMTQVTVCSAQWMQSESARREAARPNSLN